MSGPLLSSPVFEIVVWALAGWWLYERLRAAILGAVRGATARRRARATVAAVASAMADQGPRLAQHRRIRGIVENLQALQASGHVRIGIQVAADPHFQRSEHEIRLAVVLSCVRDLVHTGAYAPEEIEAAVMLAVDSCGGAP